TGSRRVRASRAIEALRPVPLAISFIFFLNTPATPEIYTLSLHDALPIYLIGCGARLDRCPVPSSSSLSPLRSRSRRHSQPPPTRSEEHTSELQSPYDLVCRLLLEKKKKT